MEFLKTRIRKTENFEDENLENKGLWRAGYKKPRIFENENFVVEKNGRRGILKMRIWKTDKCNMITECGYANNNNISTIRSFLADSKNLSS